MRFLQHRLRGPKDEGSILLALFAIMVVSGLLTVGLATIVNAHVLARHDTAFESALTGAEQGLDELIAQVKASPTSSSFTPVSGTTNAGVAYQATATASAGTWLIDATGTATVKGHPVTRHIQATVTFRNLLDDTQGKGVPLFGETAVNLATPSGVDRYDSSVSSDVCTTGGTQTSMVNGDTRMCQPAAPRFGVLATDGTLNLSSADLSNIAEADIDNAPAAGSADPDFTGKCGGDTGVCNAIGAKVQVSQDRLDYPLSSLCGQGIGGGVTAYDGSTSLAANTVYNFTNVTLSAAAVADLSNVANSRLVICFNGTLTLPPLVPLNSTSSPGHPLLLDPRPPTSLLLISTSACPQFTVNGSCAVAGIDPPAVNFGAGLPGETAVSAVIYAPNAACTATGHVDVYGTLICASVAAPSGLDVHYDTQVASFGASSFDRGVTVSHWHEITN